MDLVVPVSGAGNSVIFGLVIPSSPGLVGLSYHMQAIVPDPQSALGLVMSAAASAVTGF